MPLYDYKCSSCHQVTEVRHGFGESFASPCPECGGKLDRIFNPAPIVFKGSGFYVTDSRGKSQKSDTAVEKPAAAKDVPVKDAPAKETPAAEGAAKESTATKDTPAKDPAA